MYKDDSTQDAATDIIARETIGGVEVCTQDAEFDLDDVDEVA